MDWLDILSFIPGFAPLAARVKAILPRAEAIVAKIEAGVAFLEGVAEKVTATPAAVPTPSPAPATDPVTGLPLAA